jgi:hypothetical protein
VLELPRDVVKGGRFLPADELARATATPAP